MPQRRRALLFTGGMLGCMIILGQQYTAGRSATPLGEPITPPQWLISYCVPQGWQQAEAGDDLIGQTQFIYADRHRLSLLSVGRLDVTDDTTATTLAEWMVTQLHRREDIPVPVDTESRETRLGTLPARELDWSIASKSGETLFRSRVIAAVTPRTGDEREGYTIALVAGGPSERRFEHVWSAVLESVEFEEAAR